MKVSLIAFTAAALGAVSTEAFCPAQCVISRDSWSLSSLHAVKSKDASSQHEPYFFPFEQEHVVMESSSMPMSMLSRKVGIVASAAFLTAGSLFPLGASAAAGPDWGLFEGRTGSLIHPVVMGGLFLYSLYTAFLGFQWRRQRTMGDDIAALKARLPPQVAAAGGSVQKAIAAAREAQEDASSVAELRAAETIEAEIKALQQERKELAAAAPRDRHFAQGATLSFLGTAVAIEGCLNTYGRAGKLFPGPHLYAGAALLVLWGLAVSTVPAMQKGDETARTVHIAANILSMAFFFWQVTTGLPIMFKVIELTSWP